MWFKLFVLLRLPISAVCLFGYATILHVWNESGMEFLVGIFIRVLFVFLAVVLIQLVRRQRSALRLAGWLVAVELVGAVGLLAGGDYVYTRRFNSLSAVGVLCGVLVFWTLPNVAVLYSQRVKFAEPETKRPGL